MQLLASPRDEAWRPRDLELDVVGHLHARLLVADDEPCEHERLRLGARLCETALDQDDVEPLLRHAARLASARHDATRADEPRAVVRGLEPDHLDVAPGLRRVDHAPVSEIEPDVAQPFEEEDVADFHP